MYPGETTTQIVQEIIYFIEDPFVRDKDFAEIRVRSGDSPEVRVALQLIEVEKLKSEKWYRVEATGELYAHVDEDT